MFLGFEYLLTSLEQRDSDNGSQDMRRITRTRMHVSEYVGHAPIVCWMLTCQLAG